MVDFSNKITLITGGGRGLGRLMALKMAVGTIPVDSICDMNGDDSVTSLDATLIREIAVSL